MGMPSYDIKLFKTQFCYIQKSFIFDFRFKSFGDHFIIQANKMLIISSSFRLT